MKIDLKTMFAEYKQRRQQLRREPTVLPQEPWPDGPGEHTWVYEPADLSLVCKDRRGEWVYDIELDRCGDGFLTSEALLDWIMQCAGKTWLTHADIGRLVRAVQELLEPQSTLCGGSLNGASGTRLNVSRFLAPAPLDTPGPVW